MYKELWNLFELVLNEKEFMKQELSKSILILLFLDLPHSCCPNMETGMWEFRKGCHNYGRTASLNSIF